MITLAIVDVKKHHPEWINLDDNTVSCSECGAIYRGMTFPDFCPNCMADMMEVTLNE